MDMILSKLWEIDNDREAWHAAVHELQSVGHDWVIENNNRTEVTTSLLAIIQEPFFFLI